MSRDHFIGIGGIGMSGLAQIMLHRGHTVSGSDSQVTAMTDRLAVMGATIYSQQVASNIEMANPETVIVTAAIHEDNPELIAARVSGAEIISRADFLGRVLEDFPGHRICITGTHGKTTTTAMITQVLVEAGLDPTSLIGGEYTPISGNLRLGSGDSIISEACEAYSSFLSLYPTIAVITNIEADHLDHYGSMENVVNAFAQFVNNIAPGGTLILNVGDQGCVDLLSNIKRADISVIRYSGLDDSYADVVCTSADASGFGMHFEVLAHGESRSFDLIVPGLQNVENALAAIAVGEAMKLDPEAVAGGLKRFPGVGRRFEMVGTTSNNVLVVDDYAHHPTEIDVTIKAAREAAPHRRLVVIFQPHLYSRTKDFLSEFALSLSRVDVLILTDIYAAREAPIAGVSVANLVRLVASHSPKMSVLFVPKKSEIPEALCWVTHPGDLVITMGAGDVREVGEKYLKLKRVERSLETCQ
ncbi:MAG: UDP-N-acetylmuramate--L-alanine ligase [Chthonomonadales bacterium]